MQLSQSPNVDLDAIADTIAADPFLAGRLIAVANSAAFAGKDRLDGLKPILMRVGLTTVRNIVFTESMRLRIFSARTYKTILEDSWKLSVGTSIACDALSGATGIERGSGFLLGLLHDTGKPVLVNAVSEIERANGGKPIGEEKVEILLSQLHEEVGGHVLERWGMPPSFVSAARDHTRYQGEAAANPASRLVHAGNLICRHLGIGGDQKDVDFTIERVFVDLNLAEEERILSIVKDVEERVERMLSGLQKAA
jgi:HD-like signal output (HDOD) protein